MKSVTQSRQSHSGLRPELLNPNPCSCSRTTGQAPGIFNIFPTGFNKGPYMLICAKGFRGQPSIVNYVDYERALQH